MKFICDLTDKEKLDAILHGDCKYWYTEKKATNICLRCPYWKRDSFAKFMMNEVFGTQLMTAPTGIIFKFKK